MDADRFDALSRALAAPGSRRRALAAALSGALVPLLTREEAAAHDPSKKCKKKSGKAKKKCLKKAKKHNAQHVAAAPTCTPSCATTNPCGSDGCGGSCGSCSGGATCASGTCICPDEQEPCKGTCVAVCESTQARNPLECTCCRANGFTSTNCSNGGGCCSGICNSAPDRTGGVCAGIASGDPCEFDAQCANGDCLATGVCN